MAESRSHKQTAQQIADKYKTEYNRGAGADVQTKNIAVEVETPDTVGDASRQLQGHRKPVYIAGTNQEAVNRALASTQGTTIGVMDKTGKIIKPSTRKRK